MKKKLFLVFTIVAVFACLFAISVSAAGATENTYGEITPIDGVAAPTTIDSTSRVVIKATDGTYYTFPSYYLLADQATASWVLLDDIKTLTGASKASEIKKYIVRMEIPEGIEALCTDMFKQSTTLIAVKFPTTLTDIGLATFAQCSNLTTAENLENTKITALRGQPEATYNNATGCFASCSSLTSLSLPSTVTYIEQWAATTCTSLASVTIPHDAKITYIGRYAFEKSIITEFYFSSELETLGYGAFFNCSKLQKIENFENTKIQRIENDTFRNAPITYIDLPSTLTFIGEYGFGGHKAIQDKLVIPNGVTSIGKCAFAGNKTTIGEVVLPAELETMGIYAFEKNYIKVFYLPETITAIPQGVFKEWSSNFVVVYTGTEEQLKTLIANSSTSDNGNFTTDAVKNIKSAEAYGEIVVANVTGKSIVYGYNFCKAFYENKHDTQAIEGSTCQGECSRCELTVELEDAKHQNVWIFNGGEAVSFTATITAEHICKYCELKDADKEPVSISAILYSDGISIDETDFTGIYEQIKVNKTALETYATLSGQEFDYGIFALAAGENETSAPIIKGQDGKAVASDDKTVYASFTGTEYTYLRIKITGLSNGSSIFCGAYLIIGDNIVYVSNRQEGTTVTKYTIVTQMPQQ